MTIFSHNNKKNNLEKNCFFDEPLDIARYDIVKYSQFEKLTKKQLGFFWMPEEVDLTRDSKDFNKSLTAHEQHIFTGNIKRQILLDSFQGRAPSLAFLPVCSLPEIETFIQTWSFFETIHSRSYTHIIRNIYSNPSIVFDDILSIPEIVECAHEISKYYDRLIVNNETTNNLFEQKKSLWLCLNAVNALEGVRFYVSFACSWNFAELKKMEGNAKIIKFIARDENVHLAATQQLIKILPKEDADFAKIREQTKDEVSSIFSTVVEQEKNWAKYLFKDGSMIGLNEQLLCEYVDYIAAKRLQAIGYATKPGNNPLPWTQKWIAGSEVQVAPQEVEISSYILGGIKKDIEDNSFKGFNL